MLEQLSGNFLQWLRGFYFVARLGRISLAAAEMKLDQSAVSHQLRNLEKMLNVTLFLRQHKELVITEAGKQLFEKTIPLFEHVQSILAEVGRGPNALRGHISIATTHAIAENFLSDILVDFLQEYPEVTVQLLGGGAGSILDGVQAGGADFGIASQTGYPEHIIHKPLFDSQFVLISPKANPFGLPPRPTFTDLENVPFISLPPQGTVEAFIKPMLFSRGIFFKKPIIANTYTLLLHYVRCKLGVTILDAFAVHKWADDFMLFNIDEDLPPRRYSLIYRKQKYITPQSFSLQKRIMHSAIPYGCVPLSPDCSVVGAM